MTAYIDARGRLFGPDMHTVCLACKQPPYPGPVSGDALYYHVSVPGALAAGAVMVDAFGYEDWRAECAGDDVTRQRIVEARIDAMEFG